MSRYITVGERRFRMNVNRDGVGDFSEGVVSTLGTRQDYTYWCLEEKLGKLTKCGSWNDM